MKKYLIGIDEAGRGPLAGPVAVGTVMFLIPNAEKHFRGVKESKQLTAQMREAWFEKILEAKDEGILEYSVSLMSEKIIDRKGIVFAIRNCIQKNLKLLPCDASRAHVLLDGGLKAAPEYSQETIIKGDEKVVVIALASIVAKVTRDRFMLRLAKKYPAYGFEQHKGYGTRAHYSALKKHGPSPIHRLTYL